MFFLCVIITVGVNDAQREGHSSGVAAGTEDMYLPSPETFIKQQGSVHITSRQRLGPRRATLAALFIFHRVHMPVVLPCGPQKQLPVLLSKGSNKHCRATQASGGSEPAWL